MGDRYVISDDKKKIMYIDSNTLYVCALSQSLPYDELNFGKEVELEGFWILKTIVFLLNSLNVVYHIRMIKEKKLNISTREKYKINPVDFAPYYNEKKPNIFTQNKKVTKIGLVKRFVNSF